MILGVHKVRDNAASHQNDPRSSLFDLLLLSWHIDEYGEHTIIMMYFSTPTVLLKGKKKIGSGSVTKELKLNNGFSTSSSRIYVFASWIIHALHTCHILINVTYI